MKNFILLGLIFLAVSVNAQKRKNKGPNFNITDFNKKFEVAQWLYEYDAIAWWTSDSVMLQSKAELSRLGKEWFCFQDANNVWHAIYGKYDNGKFDLVFHYLVDSTYTVKRTKETVDSATLNSYSRALITANNKFSPLRDTVNIAFNQYIKRNTNQTFTVWFLPAFQPDETAIYGGEFIYTIDKSGNKLLADSSYFSGEFRGFQVGTPREIYLNYEKIKEPTLGGIFFVWYYKKYFTNIYLNTKQSRSTVMQNESKSYYWLHIDK